jgi:hypothetical protein
MQCSRRSLLLTPLAALFPALPAWANPLPIIFRALKLIDDLAQVVDGVMAIVKWTKDATNKLDELVNMSVDITDELKQINILLKKSGFPEFVENDLKADIKHFKINLSELEEYKKQDRDTHIRIDLLTHQIEHDVLRSLEYGPAAFETTYTAAIVLRALYKYVDMPRDHQNQFFATVADQFGAWLDPSKEDSPAKLQEDEKRKITDIKDKVSKILDKYKAPISYMGVEVRIEIVGDLANGFKVRKSSKVPDLLTENPTNELKRYSDAYNKSVANKALLDEVVSQLEQYHQSLLDVAKGGRLSLLDKHQSRPTTRLR